MSDDGDTTAANSAAESERVRMSRQARPSVCSVSDALTAMHRVYESGMWRHSPDATLCGLVGFMDAVDPDCLSKDEQEFVVKFVCAVQEVHDKGAKGGAA